MLHAELVVAEFDLLDPGKIEGLVLSSQLLSRVVPEDNAVLLEKLRQRLGEMAATPEPGTPAQMRSFAASEIKRWREVVKASGAKVD